jgi:hypothetical protein
VIEVLTPNADALAAHQRLASLPSISRSLTLKGDDRDADAVRLTKLALKAAYNRLYGLQKIAAETGRTDAALTAAMETAKADISRRKTSA